MAEYDGPRLREELAALQLPGGAQDGVVELREYFDELAISENDAAILLAQGREEWEKSGSANSFVQGSVRRLLIARLSEDIAEVSSKKYFSWFKDLSVGTNDWNGISSIGARRLLSRLPLIFHLLSVEKMSCTQVSRLIHSIDASLEVPYQAIAVIARGVGHLPLLNMTDQGDQLWDFDEDLAVELFPDSTVAESCEVAGREAAEFAPESDVSGYLRELSVQNEAGEVFWPYLQILHFCCVPLEYFDHPASFLYEFSPRGNNGQNLFKRYPAHTGNPFLNNAKAVHTLDRAWARTRGGNNAQALVAVLELLESLPTVTRRQLARIFRAWLHRVVELETTEPVLLPATLALVDFERVVARVSNKETNTKGVIEQRVVDALAMLAFSHDDWRSKGIGESVNASNFARRKLGDVEFASISERAALALEAHGGHLSATYVIDHQRSLGRIIEQRLRESWSSLDEPSNWSIEIIFVAHSRDKFGLPTSEVLHGVAVTYKYWEYEQISELAVNRNDNPDVRLNAFRSFTLEALNQRTTRQSVRNTFVSLIGN
ncbi:hypothetical protein [Glaciihabitans sp. UYNi722]|uniref:hypothetical protein n=1 Tax=Glaciihabitans sp. UYNi722 TaxID=3156344 RepID=UPI003392A17B